MVRIGALTNKITAFSYRPWDLVNVSFRTPNSELIFGNMPTKVVRVLKTSSPKNDDFWITDIERFKYDSLTRQRLVTPIHKQNHRILKFNSNFNKFAIFDGNIDYTTFSLINYRVDTSILSNNKLKLDLFSCSSLYKPSFSSLSTINSDNKFLFFIDPRLFLSDISIQTKLSQFKNEPNFYFFSFGNLNLNWIHNMGSFLHFNNLFLYKNIPLLNTLDDLNNSSLILLTDQSSSSMKAIYDFCASLFTHSLIVISSKDINSIYRYSGRLQNDFIKDIK